MILSTLVIGNQRIIVFNDENVLLRATSIKASSDAFDNPEWWDKMGINN